MIKSILIANRGEIACRIMDTCRIMGIETIAVFSDADRNARHVAEADRALHIGASPASESYLVIDRIIDAAKRTGADAIHPGFGFLAENVDFARACKDNDIIFIGPAPESIEAMGNKRAAKALMQQVGVPVIPGYDGDDQSDERLLQEAERIGFPLMVKASAGGGGKGMRLVHKPEKLLDALVSARREALQAFGSDDVMLERAIINPRHIEIQVIGDHHGNLIHLGERECSIQRRHQKIIEEAPSPVMSDELRENMGASAIQAAKAVDYYNAGTVEFLLDENGDYYFLEMNTRLQVEHRVTELVTYVDLVKMQIHIADGQVLSISQDDVQIYGHAIEARIYAENPANDFLPSIGEVVLWDEPPYVGVWIDSGLKRRDQISMYYDPMIAKYIADGLTRESAIRQLSYALRKTVLFGVENNIAFLRDVIEHEAFEDGNTTTAFIDEHFQNWQPPQIDPTQALIVATVLRYQQLPHLDSTVGYWRNNANRPEQFRFQVVGANTPVDVWLTPYPDHFLVRVGDDTVEHDVQLKPVEKNDFVATVMINGIQEKVTFACDSGRWYVHGMAGTVVLDALELLPLPQPAADAGGSLRAPMPGSVIAVLVEVGQTVSKGDALMKLEAMKMEHTITTMADGVVSEIFFAVGDTVNADDQLLRIEETID